MSEVIEFDFVTKATAGEVWHALTDRDELENWWGEGVVLDPKAGGKFCEPWEDDDGARKMAIGKVKAAKANKEIVFTWVEKDWPKGSETECTFTIQDDGKLRKLSLKHVGWDSLPKDKRTSIIKDFKIGWGYHMKELKSYLDE
ncbi:hypothetical protein D3C72_2016270 [compost metagenome]